jgi:hypothetical protein
MEKMWTVSYKEYLNFTGVKEHIEEIKSIKKLETRTGLAKRRVGEELEQSVLATFSKHPELELKQLPAQMDIGFGADFQVSYKEDGKNYSFFLDVTRSKKPITKYLTASGNLTQSLEEAFCYDTDTFKIHFGLKERHSALFFYEKPVVVMSIALRDSHLHMNELDMHNVGHILMSLNALLKEKGYGARASQRVRPNITIYRKEFRRSL